MNEEIKRQDWVVENIFKYQQAISSKFKGGMMCLVCRNTDAWAVPEQYSANYVRVSCARCGYVMEFSKFQMEAVLKHAQEGAADE